MNRLWVRLSIVISGFILIVALYPLFAFFFFIASHPPPESTTNPPTGENAPPPIGDPWRRVPEDVLRAFVLAGIFGVVGGVVVSRVMTSPITKLADAAQAIGAGDLTTRVSIKQSSQEIEELATAFNRMAADLQHSAELRNSLMADVSHELRTPLTVLEGNLRAALDHVYDLDDEQIANLYEQTRHLIRLVSELRELALAEAAQLPLDIQPIDLHEIVQETVAVFEPLANEKGVALRDSMPAELPAALADPNRIRQVLHNLLANALRHTPPGGAIYLDAYAEGGRVSVAVHDNGEGISPNQLDFVFNRFYRTDPSRSRETGGSGLGLAIVKAIVEAHGGAVAAASPGLGQGATFTITLPATHQSAARE
ncbi:MAG: HAMP domain-containing protein [Anaerolineales bacterium]|nr:HAMP domain-containing protein [Anaerolineales bacterium]